MNDNDKGVTVKVPKRPWRTRIWFYKPEWDWEWYFDSIMPIRTRIRRLLIPVWFAGDEYDWHTIVFGWNFTGEIVIATHACRGSGKCAEIEDEIPGYQRTFWPVPMNGPMWTHDCDKCIYLGSYDYKGAPEGREDVDLYWCGNDLGGATMIARYSDEGSDYSSGMLHAEYLAPLAEAKKRAELMGLSTHNKYA